MNFEFVDMGVGDSTKISSKSKTVRVLSIRLIGVFMVLNAHSVGLSLAQDDASSAVTKTDRTVKVTPGIGDRPLIREPSGLRYLGPKPLSPGREYTPFVKPEYYEAPGPPTEKYQEQKNQKSDPAQSNRSTKSTLKPLRQ